jgi:hypothetical protein
MLLELYQNAYLYLHGNRRFGGTSGSVFHPLSTFVSLFAYFSTPEDEDEKIF